MNCKIFLMVTCQMLLQCLGVYAQGEFTSEEILDHLRTSRELAQTVYSNCQIETEYWIETPDGEKEGREKRRYASGHGCFRVDVDDGEKLKIRCANAKRVSFRASRSLNTEEFVVDSTSESFKTSCEVIFNVAQVGNSLYGILNLDVFELILGRTDVVFSNIKTSVVDGVNFVELDYTVAEFAEFSTTMKFFIKNDVWILKEIRTVGHRMRNVFEREHNGVPLLSRFEYTIFDPGIPTETGEPGVAYSQVSHVTNFNTSPPPKSYFTLEGLGVESARSQNSFWFWLIVMLLGITLLGGVFWIRNRNGG